MSQENPMFTAVREDATSFCMDWPVFEAAVETSEIHFEGTVFVLDCDGCRIGDTPLAAPSDRAADEALNRIGWARRGGWHRDAFGRQSAKVIAVGAISVVRPGWEQSSADRIGSLAEEAALHLA